MHGQKLKIFKRPKNREDGSDFDEIRTKKKRSNASCLIKTFRPNEMNKKYPKNSKNYRTNFRKILKIDIADVINY